MTLVVHPDPQEPAGGYAFFELPRGSLPMDTAPVAIFDAYGERWLAAPPEGGQVPVEPGPWNNDRHTFGPYTVYRHDGADWVRVGPEIVNRLEEYQPLRITVGFEEYAVTWPDTVPPRAGAAVLGGIRAVARPAARADGPQLVGRPAIPPEPEPEEPEEILEEDEEEDFEDTLVPPPPVAARGRFWLPALLLLLLIAGGAAAWWFWPRGAATALPDIAPVSAETCTAQALGAVSGGFAGVGAALRGCGREVSPDLALQLAEDFAARDDPAALYLLGVLYDGETLDARIENLIGLTFAADDARAAEYYNRATSAGSQDAPAALAATCARLQGAQSTLARGAFDDFCG